MLFMIRNYKSIDEFNAQAAREFETFRAQNPDASADRYWQVAGYKVSTDGSLVVLWSRKVVTV